MSTYARNSYHHGDLRSALTAHALEMLQTTPTFSLRTLAKETGVSPTAVYRHFADKSALETSLAAQGYTRLLSHLETINSNNITDRHNFYRLAVAYIEWAQENEALFSLMYTTQCDQNAPERIEAVQKLQNFLSTAIAHCYPEHTSEAFLTGIWALVHGLATLHIQGKLLKNPNDALDTHVEQIWINLVP